MKSTFFAPGGAGRGGTGGGGRRLWNMPDVHAGLALGAASDHGLRWQGGDWSVFIVHPAQRVSAAPDRDERACDVVKLSQFADNRLQDYHNKDGVVGTTDKPAREVGAHTCALQNRQINQSRNGYTGTNYSRDLVAPRGKSLLATNVHSPKQPSI